MKEQRDKQLWIFNAGTSYAGNPKWMFEYIVRHHKEITPVWMCYETNTRNYVRKLGYQAELYRSASGKAVMKQAGVYVVEMCKEVFQPELEGITILNLWHGVGCKSIERKVTDGFLRERIARKYIQYNDIFRNNQLFLVTSELMEKHFKEQCGIDDDKVIRAGYPRCVVQDPVNSYNHDIRAKKGLGPDTRLAVYCPTYRDNNGENFMKSALPDMKRLADVLAENQILLILKMHPQVEKDTQYLAMKDTYRDHPYLYFWENEDDIYEIFDTIDIAIVDYSSIFYDLLARGVKTFIRYFYDLDCKENFRDFVFDVREMTCGQEAGNFEELLAALSSCKETSAEELERIRTLFWSYSDENDCERIIERALSFQPDTKVFPKLYSFDIFDTLFSRQCCFPSSVFDCVRRKMENSDMGYDTYFIRKFSQIRRWCEANVREFYKKSVLIRNDDRLEIQLTEIYDHMGKLFSLTEEQKAQLLAWECEAEIRSVIPLKENIELLKSYQQAGNDVVLISDMYLPKEVIQKMLAKADPLLATLPLFLSSDTGYQKTTKKLFLTVYDSLDYHYSEWIHIGDNKFADDTQPSRLGIHTQPLSIPELNDYEKTMASYIEEYGVHSIVKLFRNFRLEGHDDKEIFAYEYASLYFVPYVHWTILDAMKRGYKTLYFISRDGHYLKLIADAIIKSKGLPIKTKYIYGSRKAWRVPSFLEKVDDEFFELYGNFSGVRNFKNLLKALQIDEETFDRFFPELGYLKTQKRYSDKLIADISKKLKRVNAYQDYLLEIAAEQRKIVVSYLKQEIDFNEPFAFVEYWGRGYTQDCLTRLLQAAAGRKVDNPMYYVRSIYPTIGSSIRYNYTCNTHSVVFAESIFANLSYRTIEKYEKKEGTIQPVLHSCENDTDMNTALETYLVRFAKDFCGLELEDEVSTGHYLYDFGMAYFTPSTDDHILLDIFGSLKDAVALGERAEEYAPPVTFQTIIDWLHGKSYHTKSYEMSMKKTSPFFRLVYKSYCYYCDHIRGRLFRRKK